MKNPYGRPIVAIIAFAVACLISFSASFAADKGPAQAPIPADKVGSILAPLSIERIAILLGEKAMIPLGLKDGIIKGDVGIVAADQDKAATGTFVGQCAVVKSSPGSSVCEVITQKMEVEGGDLILFDRVRYRDPNAYPLAIAMLSDIVEPYEPYKPLKIMVYGVFDDQNAVTGFSDAFKREIASIFSQKKRIQVVDGGSEFKDFVFYPGADADVLRSVRAKMKKAEIDVLLIGKCASDGQAVIASFTALSAEGAVKSWKFSFPNNGYADSLAKVVVPPQEPTQVETYPCYIYVKTGTAKVAKANEKAELIRSEAEGDAFAELSLKRSDFNIMSPVDIKVKVDNALVVDGQRPIAPVTVSVLAGTHRVVVSFHRGYFFDESLVYTSLREVRKEINLELHTVKNLSLDVQLSPLFSQDTIAVKAFERIGNQQQVLRPIRRVQWDTAIETFKD
jgi:hypothetical protein